MGQVSLTLMDDKPVGPLRKQDRIFTFGLIFFRVTMVLREPVQCTVVQAKVKSSLGMSKNSKT